MNDMKKWVIASLLVTVIVNSAYSQFTKKIEFFNPSAVESVTNHRFAFGDLDKDGDLDMVVGEYQGRLLFYRNTGTPTSPRWSQELSMLDEIDIPPISGPPFSAPVLGDVDGDLDLDLIVGVRGSSSLNDIYFFRNTGTPYEASWRQENTVIQISEGEMAIPYLVDLDADSDLDMVIGDVDGTLHYYKNVGDAMNPDWVEEVTFFLTPTYIDVGKSSSPSLADMDNDGDFDLLIGADDGILTFYENTGNASSPNFTEVTDLFAGIDAGRNSNPTLVDLDGDGDHDLIIGNWENGIYYYENTGTKAEMEWTYRNANFRGIDVGMNSAPAFFDVNNDGLPDLVAGHKQSTMDKPFYVFMNNGTLDEPVWEENIAAFPGVTNIFDRFVTPEFVDLDGDEDEDIVVGAWDGRIYYFENTGTKSAPVWEYRPLMFLGIDIGNYSIPVFADLDSDGDYDLTIGEEIGHLAFFWNEGTPQNPQFDINEADTSIYSNIDVGSNSAPAFIDIDEDGDLDLIIGEYEGVLNYYENTGGASYPRWEYKEEFFQELNFDADFFVVPKVFDIDGDGKKELIIGEQSGTLKAYWNDSPSIGDTGPSFSNFIPNLVYDTTSFHISGIIADENGVYDDNTGSDGQGVYLMWDSDGELFNSANELQLSRVNGDTFRTIAKIPSQFRDADFVYRVSAYDNASGTKNQGVSSQLRIDVMDDDDHGPLFLFFTPDSVDENQSFFIEVGLSDPGGYYDDETTSDGQGAFLRWDTDGELSASYQEMAMSEIGVNLFRSDTYLPGQINDSEIVYQVYIFDDDFDNNYAVDRKQSISNIRHVYVRNYQSSDDDDVLGPEISNIVTVPAQVYDTTSFFIQADISDASGVFDDTTGSTGQGVHVRWDTDGEINIDFRENTMSNSAGTVFLTDEKIPSQFWESNFVFQVFAYDNDFDESNPLDRKLGVSSVQSVEIIDDDPNPPVFMNILPSSVSANTPFFVEAVLRDSSGIFTDASGSAGQGIHIVWDTDGELLLSSNETAMVPANRDTFIVESSLPGLAAGSEFVFNIVAYDNDFDNGVAADRAQARSQLRNVVIYAGGDADRQGPSFSNWQPLVKYDDEAFVLSGEIYDPAGVYDDQSGSDGKGIYVLWDTDGELTQSANEMQVEIISGSMYQTVDSIQSQPADVDVVYQIFAWDDDTDTGDSGRSLGISMAHVVRILDDDDEAPVFSDFSPVEVFDSTSFYIECNIDDASGIYDDETGSSGSGIYLLMDTDGELSKDANEIEMEKITDNRYQTVQPLHLPKMNQSLVYQVFARDNDFDNQKESDRKVGVSLAQSIFLRDDDTSGPTFSNFSPVQIQTGIEFHVECDIYDSSDVYDDNTGAEGQGVYLRWDRDGELDQTSNEILMDSTGENRFRSVEAIDGLAEGDVFVYQVFAFDNDFDNSFAADRKQSASAIRQIEFSNTEFRFIKFGTAPNPFTESIYFIFNLSKDAEIKIDLFTLAGERVVQLKNHYVRGNTAEIEWNGTNEAGNELASGVYMFRFVAKANGKSIEKFGKVAIVR